MRSKSKSHITQVAMKMFASRGYHSTSMNAIAKKAGIAVGLIYNYYSSKEALMQEIVEYAMAEYNDRMREMTKEAALQHDLVAMIEAAYTGIQSEVETWLLFIRAMTEVRGVDFSKLAEDYYFQKLEEVAVYHFLEQGIDDAKDKGDMICELVYGLILDYIISGDLDSLRRTLDNMIKFIITKWEVE